jgi:DNA replication and repair protein RecF
MQPEVEATLDVWDAKLAAAGEALAREREQLVAGLDPEVGKAYAQLAQGAGIAVSMAYRRSWEGPLSEALGASRHDDVRRGITTVGPHHDELELAIAAPCALGPVGDRLPARTHASQGEQRSLALALRLGAHALTTEVTGTPPVLLLDDVFSELDAARGAALLAHLPDGQALLTTTGPIPSGIEPDKTVRVRAGQLQ